MKNYFKIILAALVITTGTAQAGLPPTRSSGFNDPTLRTTFDFLFPNMTISRTGVKSSISTPQDIFTTSNVTFNNEIIAGHLTLTNPSYDGIDVGNSLLVNGSTGLLTGGLITINGVDPTKFDLSVGFGVVINTTTPSTPTLKRVFFGPFVSQTVTALATADFTYIYINPDGSIFQSTTLPDPATRRAKMFIGRLNHSNRTSILFADNIPDISYNIASQYYDLLDALGPFNINGNTISPNGVNLQINKSAGQIFQRSSNYAVTNQNPHVKTTPASIPVTFAYQNQTGASITLTTSVDPTTYDVGGVTTPVTGSGSVSTVQRVYLFNSNNVRIQRGQATYNTLAGALQGFQQEQFVVNPVIQGFGVLIAYIAVTRSCTDLSSTCATILAAPKFGSGGASAGGGGGTSSFQQVYNNSISPQILFNPTLGGLLFQDNIAPLGANLFTISNNGGTSNYFNVNANGIDTSGSFANNTQLKSANYTLTASDHTIVGTTGGIVLTLPASVNRREYIIKNSSTSPIKISGHIEGVTTGTYTIYSLQSVRFQGDGTTWYAQAMEKTPDNNLLSNPSFENNGNAWTVTNSTGSSESVIIAQGGLSEHLTLSAQTGDILTQSITPIVQTLGQNLEASCRVKTTLSTIQVCALQGSTEVACTNAPNTGNFTYIPINMPGVSSGTIGVKVKATGSSTGDVYVDDCYVGFARNIGSVATAQLIGTVTVTGCAARWSTVSTTFVDFPVQTGCVYSATGQATAPTTLIPAIRFPSGLPAGDYRLEYEGVLIDNGSGNSNSQYQFWDGVNTAREITTVSANPVSGPGTLNQSITYSSPQSNVTFSIRGRSFSASNGTEIGGLTTTPGTIKVWYFPNSSQQAVSAQQQNYDWTAYGTPADFTGFGTVSGIELQQKREGSDLLIRGKFTSGTPTAVEARVNLPPGLVSANTSKIPSLANSGKGNVNAAGASNFSGISILMEPSVSYLTLGAETSSANGLTKALGTGLVTTGNIISFQARIPIQGWIQTNSASLLVNSVTSSNAGAIRTELAQINNTGTAAIVTQTGDVYASATRASLGIVNIVFKTASYSNTPVCLCSPYGSTNNNWICSVNSTTSTGTTIYTFNSGTTLTDFHFTVSCTGPR